MSTPIFKDLRQHLVQLLTGLENDIRLTWTLRQTLFLDQRFHQIHQKLVCSFADDGIRMPSDAASRQVERLFQEFGELVSELEDDSDLWTANHRNYLSNEFRRIHERFSQLLDDAVDRVSRKQMIDLQSDLIRYIETFFRISSKEGGQP